MNGPSSDRSLHHIHQLSQTAITTEGLKGLGWSLEAGAALPGPGDISVRGLH